MDTRWLTVGMIATSLLASVAIAQQSQPPAPGGGQPAMGGQGPGMGYYYRRSMGGPGSGRGAQPTRPPAAANQRQPMEPAPRAPAPMGYPGAEAAPQGQLGPAQGYRPYPNWSPETSVPYGRGMQRRMQPGRQDTGYPGYRGHGGSPYPGHRQYGNPPGIPARPAGNH